MQQVRALTPHLVQHWVVGNRWWFDTGHQIQGGWVPSLWCFMRHGKIQKNNFS